MKDKALSMLGICRKAGKLEHGFDAAAESAKKGKAELVVVSKDLSPKSKKEIAYIMSKVNTEIIAINATMDEIGSKTGKRAGILAVTDRNLAESVRIALRRADEEE